VPLCAANATTSAAALCTERQLLFVATIAGTFSATGVFFDRASDLADHDC
jgi:hypothetical protein